MKQFNPCAHCGWYASQLVKCYPYIPQQQCNHNCCGCTNLPKEAQKEESYPSGGRIKESFFMLNNSNPYICDNSNDLYGTKLCISENVYTRIHRKQDQSCVNLVGTLDMTDSMTPNTVLNHYLTQIIGNKFDELGGLLNIMKNTVNFVLYFHVEDEAGGTVYSNQVSVPCMSKKLHFTDVQDVLVTSFKNLYNIIIPPMDYAGMYTLCLDKIIAKVDYVKTSDHVEAGLNPFYQFTDNNTKIVMQHDAIQSAESAGSVEIAYLDLNQYYPFQANITTRLRFSFVAYLSGTIFTMNTYDVWEALNTPTEQMIRKIQQDVDDLKDAKTEAYGQGMEYAMGKLLYLIPGQVYQCTRDFTSDATPGATREQSMLTDISAGNIVPVSFE